jgi:hypothetical protein
LCCAGVITISISICMMAMRVLLAFALLSGIASAQESVTVLRGSVVVEAANFTRKVRVAAPEASGPSHDGYRP